MKLKSKIVKLIIVLIIFSYPSFIVAQDSTKARTRIDSFSNASGKFIEKEFIHVGNINGIEVQVFKATDVITNTSLAGLHFELNYASFGSYRTGIANLDEDEVDGLIQCFKYIKSNVLSTKPDNYKEYNYISKDNFKAGCYIQKKQRGWSLFFQLDEYLSSSLVEINVGDIDDLIELLEDSKKKF